MRGKAGTFAIAGKADPHFADVSLLLHFDGSNGSTTFTDSSDNAETVTANSGAEISTAQSKFGGSSGYFASGAYLSMDTSGAAFGTGDFTIEAWIRPADVSQEASIFDTGKLTLGIKPVAYENATVPELGFFELDGTNYVKQTSGGTVSQNVWQHVAACRSNGTTRVFLDGVQVGQNLTDTADYSQTVMYVGEWPTDLGVVPYNGYIDEARITKGVARYESGFTVPARAFSDF